MNPSRLANARLVVSALAFAAAWIALEGTAHAEVKLGVELRGEYMRRFNKISYGGPGLAVDFGYSFDTYPIIIIPEIAVEGAFYAPQTYSGSFRALGGIRVGAALEVEPTLYARGGYVGIFGLEPADHGGTLEVGASLDKRLERSVTIGGSIGYQGFFVPRWAHGLSAGFHVGFWL
ncbi:MAG: hypothetical protein HOW73_47240 [Polyangiaceae bacterium]|nr:hypothetical protein [Polyangiaceae bacterium]